MNRLMIVFMTMLFTLTGCEEPSMSESLNNGKENVQPMVQNQAIEQLTSFAEQSNQAGVEELLKQGTDINGQDSAGRTAVLAATHGRKAGMVKYLIEHGADINIRDNRKDNVLLYSGAEGLLDIVKLAIEAKADTRLTNRYGGTALIPASERGHFEVVSELLEHSDIQVNHINNLGWTALMEAVVLSDGGPKHQQIIRKLLEHGADPAIPDRDGISALQHAKSRGYKEIERILLEAEAK
ncbi:ankyrin repeat domain-containing protein [Paenibacillus sp. UNC451MF]|uniref:ankyrin repeat domain-containing protein n=1 Tax=Paenibacillus sp. UNC451MF TaxID=1449063 RepID=UPI00048E7F4C|nr:ankyrin repeat domain-containing protein [Paenibacillus sp. UNC451MF]